MSKSRLMLATGACLAFALVPALAAIAAAHAGMAAGAESPQMVKSHLQHVINCLEGPKGSDFIAALGNPCGGQGEGAIPDAREDGRKKLEDAAGLAKQAMGELNVDEAKRMARRIQSDLGK